ncbi:hypothetical protein HRbin41_00109 [bacterium HR41]|nr:hypothetical protein [Thermoleophilum sp.]GBD45309.1 hypothetical protein HRbin41_00109 [bacterium HR41]
MTLEPQTAAGTEAARERHLDEPPPAQDSATTRPQIELALAFAAGVALAALLRRLARR